MTYRTTKYSTEQCSVLTYLFSSLLSLLQCVNDPDLLFGVVFIVELCVEIDRVTAEGGNVCYSKLEQAAGLAGSSDTSRFHNYVQGGYSSTSLGLGSALPRNLLGEYNWVPLFLEICCSEWNQVPLYWAI